MSFCRVTVRSPVTSSTTMLRCVRNPYKTPAHRLFSSYGNAHRSSKRDMQTATAYRPHSLPTAFPPPRSGGSYDTSISADFPPLRETSAQQQGIFSHVSLRENEAQKSKPVESTSPKPAGKPRRKLRARKAAMKLTPEAIVQLRKLLSQPDPKLIRVGVKNRGCSGLAYHLEYVEKPGTFDEVVEQDGVKVLIDSKALFSIIGSEMDWQEDKLSRRFIFKNPNISSNHLHLDLLLYDTLGPCKYPTLAQPLTISCPPSINNSMKKMTTPTFLSPNHNSGEDPTPEPLLLTIRFSASIPDLPLDVLYPETTTSAGLKQLIRTRLPPNLSSNRLRLIYAGRGLEDTVPLSVSLKLPPSPSRSPRLPSDDEDTDLSKGKGKGKAPIREQPRLYIHCSIGDIVLSAPDLATEASLASTLQQEDQTQKDGDQSSLQSQQQQQMSSTTPAPRGFDRLLSAGFTPAEVSALRSQFMAIQSVSRTPDTMPSGAELRELEDRWMDEGSSAMAAGAGGAGEGAGFTDDDGGFGSGSQGAMDDMLWGAVMGFFWPVGCAMWLRREEGVWSWRKGLAVFVPAFNRTGH
ncbi:hypothetical protein ABOM_010197 [Aspergillus bombycis]|uniref:DSC E3 ubiquitin ligase complex subunit C n=1 Tax=Aspergillus bombycis TaxID=109264 RepID=A0A1F7ZNV0_9EURO|nr:hypothetical protein ABOM_010197 [Aspergillus bombycis]OGM41127.1 hypothetical protein ABOM_010197 [Aspergillus bombycis]